MNGPAVSAGSLAKTSGEKTPEKNTMPPKASVSA